MAILHFYYESSYWQINWQIYPPVLVSSGTEWQFYMSTMRAHIGWSTGRSIPKYWHLVVKNGNFTFYYESSYWQIIYPSAFSARHHGMYIIGCIWQPLWILQEKVGICCYWWIIRVVMSHLALYSVVRSNSPQPPDTAWHPNTLQMTITDFNSETSYL